MIKFDKSWEEWKSVLKIQKVLKSAPKVKKGHKCTQKNAKIQHGQQDA